jgi:hypothetical protein
MGVFSAPKPAIRWLEKPIFASKIATEVPTEKTSKFTIFSSLEAQQHHRKRLITARQDGHLTENRGTGGRQRVLPKQRILPARIRLWPVRRHALAVSAASRFCAST